MINDTITQKIGEALKAHDEIRLSTLRLLSSAFNYEFIAKQHKLSEEEELVVVRREAKKRKEATRQFQEGGRPELAEKEEKELVLIKEYLPEEMSEEKVRELADEAIKETGALSAKETGKVMAALMPKLKGAADGALVGQIVREKLSGNNE